MSSGPPHQVVAHLYVVEQPSRPIAVISFDPADISNRGERLRRSEFLPRVGETISLRKGQRSAAPTRTPRDSPSMIAKPCGQEPSPGMGLSGDRSWVRCAIREPATTAMLGLLRQALDHGSGMG
jgi:hypothetical protein